MLLLSMKKDHYNQPTVSTLDCYKHHDGMETYPYTQLTNWKKWFCASFQGETC